MPRVFNLYDDGRDRAENRPQSQSRDAWVGAHIGPDQIGRNQTYIAELTGRFPDKET